MVVQLVPSALVSKCQAAAACWAVRSKLPSKCTLKHLFKTSRPSKKYSMVSPVLNDFDSSSAR
eukprot:4899221-Karenia_brevis.AAC.1